MKTIFLNTPVNRTSLTHLPMPFSLGRLISEDRTVLMYGE